MKHVSFSRGLALPQLLCAMIVLTCVICCPEAMAEPMVTANANDATNPARMNCGAQIECITPDGQYTSIALNRANANGASVIITDDHTVSCPLREGDTTFIISLGRSSALGRLSFINENAAARGELRIAVSNYKLPASSDKWTPVDGNVAFNHKRLFNFSMLGVEAKYVRLTFHVQSEGRIAALGLYGDRTISDFAAEESGITRASNSLLAASREAPDLFASNQTGIFAGEDGSDLSNRLGTLAAPPVIPPVSE